MKDNGSLQDMNVEDLGQIENNFDFLEKYDESEDIKVDDSKDSKIENNEPVPNIEDNSENDNTQPEDSTDNIEASVVLNFADVVLSRIFAVATQKYGYESRYQDFKLDANEKKAIEKPLQKVLDKHGFGSLSPETQLLIIVGGIYAFKFSNIEKRKERKQNVSRETFENEKERINPNHLNKNGTIKSAYKYLYK